MTISNFANLGTNHLLNRFRESFHFISCDIYEDIFKRVESGIPQLSKNRKFNCRLMVRGKLGYCSSETSLRTRQIKNF